MRTKAYLFEGLTSNFKTMKEIRIIARMRTIAIVNRKIECRLRMHDLDW